MEEPIALSDNAVLALGVGEECVLCNVGGGCLCRLVGSIEYCVNRLGNNRTVRLEQLCGNLRHVCSVVKNEYYVSSSNNSLGRLSCNKFLPASK